MNEPTREHGREILEHGGRQIKRVGGYLAKKAGMFLWTNVLMPVLMTFKLPLLNYMFHTGPGL